MPTELRPAEPRLTGPHWSIELRWSGLSEEQVAIHAAVEAFLAKHSTEAEVRRLMMTERGFDDAVWAGLAGLGVPALTVPEAYGGLGLGPVELALVMYAAGGALLCAPLLSSAVLATALLDRVADHTAKAAVLPVLASGERRATVALGETTTDGLGVIPSVHADGPSDHADDHTLVGETRFVLDGHTADLVLVLASCSGEPAVYLVEAGAPGFTATPMRTLDLTRKHAVLSFDNTPARRLGHGPHLWSTVDDVLNHARTMLAAEQVGGAQRCLATAVGYAGERVQFERVIGSFQAVKHSCANMLITLDSARATMLGAVRSPGDAAAASLAKAVCSDAYFSIAADALHVHGGLGFTWEHPSHLYFRRAKSSQLLFGPPAAHLERLVVLAGLTEEAA